MRWAKRAAGVLVLAFLLLNGLAFAHAWSFMHFARGGERLRASASLSWSRKLNYLFTGARVPRPENRETPSDYGLTFSRMMLRGHAGTPLEGWLVPHPAAQGTVILFPGYADAKASLLPVARAFNGMEFTVALVDFYGCGGSGGASTSVGYYEAEDVACARQAFDRTTTPVILYGASMGAAAVLRAVDAQRVQADALILECPFDSLLTTIERRFELLGVPAFPGARLLLFWGGLPQGFAATAFAPAENARAVSVPTLLMVGDRDRYVSLDDTRRILANLRGPRRLEVFPGAAHQSLLRADRQRWLRAVSELVEDVSPSGPGRS